MYSGILKDCKSFKPVLKSIDMPSQQELFSTNFTNNSHIKMGLFYEMLTALLFGGRLSDSLLRSQRGAKRDEGPMPDVWDRKRDRMGESKACRNGHQLNLLDGQIALYRRFQILKPNTRIYFSIWRHRFPSIKKFRGSCDELFSSLAEKTSAGIILPFTIINYIHSMETEMRHHIREKSGIILRRYEEDTWDHCTRVSSSLINSFILTPNKTISRLGLDIDDYSWNRYLVPEVTIAGVQINQPIPFILITDNDHSANVEKHINDIVPF